MEVGVSDAGSSPNSSQGPGAMRCEQRGLLGLLLASLVGVPHESELTLNSTKSLVKRNTTVLHTRASRGSVVCRLIRCTGIRCMDGQ